MKFSSAHSRTRRREFMVVENPKLSSLSLSSSFSHSLRCNMSYKIRASKKFNTSWVQTKVEPQSRKYVKVVLILLTKLDHVVLYIKYAEPY